MKKTIFVLLIIGLALCLGACNTDDGGGGGGGGGGDDAKDVSWDAKYGAKVTNADNYPGIEVLLSGRGLVDISKYSSVRVYATLYTDEEGNTKAVTPTGEKNNLAQFTLLKGTGNWDTASNKCGPTKYGMVVDGPTTWFVTEGASGVPDRLLLQANWVDFADGVRVKYIKVGEITFSAKTGSDPVVFDWGSTETDTFPTSGSQWPGRSLPLSGANTKPTLGDMSLYKEVIVDAMVYDRAGNPATASKLIDQAFFILVTDNSNWQTYETIKQYNMNVNGTTSVTPETNKVKVEDNRANRWTGIPTDIVFCGEYNSAKGPDEMVGKVALRSITFIPK